MTLEEQNHVTAVALVEHVAVVRHVSVRFGTQP